MQAYFSAIPQIGYCFPGTVESMKKWPVTRTRSLADEHACIPTYSQREG